MKFDLELLKQVLAISAPSSNEDDALNFVDLWVTKNIPDATIDIDNKGNLYVTKGKAVSYPTFVGHLDDVHEYIQYKTIHELNGYLYAMDGSTLEQVGTAGDDKVGIYLCLEALRSLDAVKCFFPVEEEWGTIGTSECDMTFFDDSSYVIQSDRQKAEDIVTRIAGTQMTSKVFDKILRRIGKDYGYKICTFGGLTDVVTLKEQGLNVCAINIASGYYHPHTDREIVSIADVGNLIAMVADFVEAFGTKVWKHKTKKKSYSYYDSYGSSWKQDAFRWDDKPLKSDKKAIYNPQTNEWDEVDKNNMLEYCTDCSRYFDKSEMANISICKTCSEWYVKEYGTSFDNTDWY